MSMTFEQKQCLLCYLGYYTAGVDGIWGSNSKKATEDFKRAEGLEPDDTFGKDTEAAILDAVYNNRFKADAVLPVDPSVPEGSTSNNWDAVKYFTKDEFACKCGGKYCNGYPVEPEWDLIEIAVMIREHFGVPVIITSGLRCKTHNANVGGVSNSRHKLGKAMDLYVTGKSAAQVLAFVRTIPGVRYSYDIDGTCVHVDIP